MKASKARTASGWWDTAHSAAEKTVTISTPGGIGPSTSTPGRCINSLVCWKPSSTSPLATSWPTGTHCDRHSRTHQVGLAAGDCASRREQPVDGIAGQYHDVERLTGLDAFGRIHATHRLEFSRDAALSPIGVGQLSQHPPRCHRRNTRDLGWHAGILDPSSGTRDACRRLSDIAKWHGQQQTI